MSTFALIHGAGDVGWYWHLVEAELRARGHEVVAPDLPADDESLGLDDYADAVVEAVGDRKQLVVAAQSFGAFTAPLVAERLPVDVLVLVAGMIPSPGERPGEWWANTGYREAVREQAARDGGLTGNEDPYVSFYHDVPRELAEEAMSKERAHPSEASQVAPWALDAWPDVPTKFVPLQRGSLLSARLLSPAGSRASEHHARRARERPLPRAQPSESTRRPPGGLRRRIDLNTKSTAVRRWVRRGNRRASARRRPA